MVDNVDMHVFEEMIEKWESTWSIYELLKWVLNAIHTSSSSSSIEYGHITLC